MRNHKDLPANSPQWLKDADVERPEVAVDKYGNITWRGGEWHGGEWRGGVSVPTRCKWPVGITNNGSVRIGCKTMSVSEWDTWFAGADTFETPRGTIAFALIHRAYMAARAAAQFELPTPNDNGE